MEYDNTGIPTTYDAAREISASTKKRLLEFFITNLSVDNVADVIDLGCGTGKFSETLAEAFDARVVGIDPSQRMLDQARGKCTNSRVTFELASGDDLPLDQGSVDMVFMSMVLHHLPNPQKTARECHRILRIGGKVCIRNPMADDISSYPYLEYFPSIHSIIQEHLIHRAQLIELYCVAGFELAAQQTVWQEVAPDWKTFAEKIALKADSCVARLEKDEFKSGLAALQSKANKTDSSQKIGQNVDSFVFRRL